MMLIHIATPGCLCDECRRVRTQYMVVVAIGDFFTDEIHLYEVLRPKVVIIDMLDTRNGYEEEIEYPLLAEMRQVVPNASAA